MGSTVKNLDQDIVDQEMINGFVREFRENIEEAIHQILLLEQDPDDIESVSSIFRKFHTIKGNAGFIGFEKMVRLSHETEALLDNIREQALAVNPQIIEALLMSADALTLLVNELAGGAHLDEQEFHDLLHRLSSHLPAPEIAKEPECNQPAPEAPDTSYLHIANEASEIFDEMVFLVMSARFGDGLAYIQDKAASLANSIRGTLHPSVGNCLRLFLDYIGIIRAHKIPFSEQAFGLLEGIFLVFIESLSAGMADALGIRLLSGNDILQQDDPDSRHKRRDQGAGASPSYCIVDLSDLEELNGGARRRVEEAVEDICRTSTAAAIIDPFKRTVVDSGAPTFVSSLEALRYIVGSIPGFR